MKNASSFLTLCLVAFGVAACSSSRDTATTAQGSQFCFECHSETSTLGQKISWAQAGYDLSVHKNGQVGRLYSQLNATGGCPPFVQATAATCTGQGGTHSGASAGNICTMPASATQGQCQAAGGVFAPAVVDARATGAAACPTFSQFGSTADLAAGNTPCQKVFGAGALVGTTCTPVVPTGASYITQNACESAGGVFVGPRFVLEGTEFEGTNAFYANGGGCQICHTQEGYRKRISKQYDTADYSIQYSWDTRAQVGSPTSPTANPPVANTSLTADIIELPSPLGCFGCHTPHGRGTTDGAHLDQSVPVGTSITTQSGGTYGSNKAKGHICAECHQIRQNANASTIAGILTNVTGSSGTFTVGATYGPHHGPQTDLLLGKGGAEYTGTASSGAFAFAGTYGSSNHTSNANADCVSCHMQSDLSDIAVTDRLAVTAAVGGHAFTNKGIVHGTEQALVLGCGSATNGVGCHTVKGVATSTGSTVAAANVTTTNGFLQAGDAFFRKNEGSADSNYHLKMNELLVKLANPSADCTGLLSQAATAATTSGKLGWALMPDGMTVDPRCIDNGVSKGLPKTAAPADDNSNASVRFQKALWNYKFAFREDKSFGVHNVKYALELLYDSCTDLALMTGKDCGSLGAGRCAFCEGQFVTARP